MNMLHTENGCPQGPNLHLIDTQCSNTTDKPFWQTFGPPSGQNSYGQVTSY